jgi:hypothetical protein
MGLGVEVGILIDLLREDPEGAERVRADVTRINAALGAAGLPAHREPETGIESASYDLGPYGSLHALRRIGAHLGEGPDLPPPASLDDRDDPVLERRYGGPGRFARLLGRDRPGPQPFAHLISHSDADGYYVPVAFSEPLVVGDEMVGSSQQLLAECDALAAALGIPDDLDPEAEALWAASEVTPEDPELWERYGLESFACVRLRAAARHSVRVDALIAFV